MGVIDFNRFPERQVLRGSDGNRIMDALLGNDGAQRRWIGFDGTTKDVNRYTGTPLTTNEYADIIQTTHGKHVSVRHSAGAADTPSDQVFAVDDNFALIGRGKELRFYNTAGNNYANFLHSGTNDILKTDDGLWIGGALGVGITPSGLSAGEVLAKGSLTFMSQTTKQLTLFHANAADQVATFQNLTGTVCLLGVANDGGAGKHLLFLDNTYDIGASGATRPRNLYLAGAATINGNLIWTTDNTYDIGASGATRPRDLFLARNAVLPGTITVASGGSGTATQILHGGATPTWAAIATGDIAANAITQSGSATGSTSDPTTTSATYVDQTDMSVTLTTTGGDLFCFYTGVAYNSAGAGNATMAFSLDAAAEVCERLVTLQAGSSADEFTLIHQFTGVSAASHTVKVRQKTAAGTLHNYLTQRSMIVVEVKK